MMGTPKGLSLVRLAVQILLGSTVLILSGCSPSMMGGSGYRAGRSGANSDPSEAKWTEISKGQMRIRVSPDRAFLFVLRNDENRGEMEILDGKSFDPLGRIPVGRGPIAVEIEGETGYVANFLSDDVTVVDLKGGTAVETVRVGRRPIRLATSEHYPYLFVSNYGSDTISVIDKRSLKNVLTLHVGRRPGDMVLDSENGILYLLNRGEGTLSVVSLDSLQVTGTVPVGEFPTGMAISRDGRFLLVSDAHTDKLKWIQTGTLSTVRDVPVGNRPMQVLRTARSGAVYVINSGSRSISLIDPDRNEVIASIPLENSPRCITASADGQFVYVSYGEEYGGITLIDMNGSTSWTSRFVQVGS
jgi:YVTN family beta-propeller protein